MDAVPHYGEEHVRVVERDVCGSGVRQESLRPSKIPFRDSLNGGLKTNEFLIMGEPMTTEYEYLFTVPDVISKNVDKWMAMVGRKVVAVGDSPEEVLAKAAEEFPGKEPFVAKFPKETAMLL